MLETLLGLTAVLVLAWRWSTQKARDGALGHEVVELSREETEAELARIRAALAAHLSGRAPLEAKAADRLAERGAWMMDRIRGLDGAQTGPAPRIRCRMELMEAAAQDAAALGQRD